METLANRDRLEKQRKADIKRQIAELQAQAAEFSDSDTEPVGPSSPKRRKLDTVLAPATPSPKKKRLSEPDARHALKSLSSLPKSSVNATLKNSGDEFIPFKPSASTLLNKLAHVKQRPLDQVESEPVPRSSAFTDVPKPPEPAAASPSGLKRDERLAIIENFEMGPSVHKPPFDDPHFQQLEPNSGIRLSSRVVPHDEFQDHLRGRYYISPSRLYSAIRLLPNKQAYDVPVDGDWITIAVVAERGPYKYSKAPVPITREDGDDEGGKGGKGKGKEKEKEPPKSSGKKFINIKLVDFGARSASSATSGKAVIRGDALLSLLLFEADDFDVVPQDEGKPRRVYRGGSRGAFEEFCEVREGDVLALLNPKVLKPFQRSNDTPHPRTNMLAITPESGASIMVIGAAKDLGRCAAVRRDGKVCGSWYDKRVSDVCEWHVQYAVEQRRAGRAEFAAGTSGMSTTATKRKQELDPRRKWGLQPLEEPSGATYVVSGHIIGAGGSDVRESMHIAENIGREGQAKASRKLAAREDARMLKALVQRDEVGMMSVMKARAFVEELGEKGKGKMGQGKSGNHGKKAGTSSGNSSSKVDAPATVTKKETKNAYTAEVIQRLGFDPTFKAGHRRHEDSDMKKKMEELARIQASRKDVKLGPPPGERFRSTVRAPLAKPAAPNIDLDADSDDEMPFSISASNAKPPAQDAEMIDLDDD